MLYPLESAHSWSNKYGIQTKEGKCPSCGVDIVADIPFADRGLRGFISEDHGCGIEKCLITFKCVSKEDKNFWLDLAQGAATPHAQEN